MTTTIRPEVSRNNPNWISRHRYYELKHFCMQYPEWKKELEDISIYPRLSEHEIRSTEHSDPVTTAAVERERYFRNVELVEKVADETDVILGRYLLNGIVMGVSYDLLRAKMDIPCCKEKYYELYRRFFSILDKKRL